MKAHLLLKSKSSLDEQNKIELMTPLAYQFIADDMGRSYLHTQPDPKQIIIHSCLCQP